MNLAYLMNHLFKLLNQQYNKINNKFNKTKYNKFNNNNLQFLVNNKINLHLTKTNKMENNKK